MRLLCLFTLLFNALTTVTVRDMSRFVKTGPNQYIVGRNLGSVVGTIYEITGTYSAQQALQDAINDIELAGGGTVLVRPGTYLLEKNLELSSRLHLKGSGTYHTILKLKDNANPFVNGGSKRSGILRVRDAHDIILSDFTIDGNKDNQINDYDHRYGRYGVFTEAVDNLWFNRLRVINVQGYGFDPHGWKTMNRFAYNLTITHCISNYNGFDGFTLDQTINIYVENCTARYNFRHGFNIVTGSKNVLIKDSVATDNGQIDPYCGSGCGITMQNNDFYDTRDIKLLRNILKRNKKAGICFKDVHDVLAKDNQIEDHTCTCFDIVKTWDTRIERNICRTKRFNRTINSRTLFECGGYKGNNNKPNDEDNDDDCSNECDDEEKQEYNWRHRGHHGYKRGYSGRGRRRHETRGCGNEIGRRNYGYVHNKRWGYGYSRGRGYGYNRGRSYGRRGLLEVEETEETGEYLQDWEVQVEDFKESTETNVMFDEFETEHHPTEENEDEIIDSRRSLLGNNYNKGPVVFCNNDYVETQCY